MLTYIWATTFESLYNIMNITIWFEFYTKIFTIAYVLLAAYVLSEFVSKSYKLINTKKSKRVYFSIYVVVFAMLYIQTLLLLTAPLNEHGDKAILVLFIYTTALMILFLIFLALTSSETYQDILTYTLDKEVVLRNSKVSLFYFSIITFCYFKLFFYDISFSVYTTLHDKFWIKELSTSLTNQRKLTTGLNSIESEILNSISRESLHGKNTAELLQITQDSANVWAIKRQPSLLVHGSGLNVDSIFTSLRVEIVQTYVEYLISGLLQALGLLFLISALIA